MKKVLGLLLFVVALAVGANILFKGGLPLRQSLSAEEQQLAELRTRLRSAQSEYRQAGRAAGLSGVDTSAQAEAALRQVERVEEDLARLRAGLTSDVARQAAQKLAEEIADFKGELR